MDLKPSLSCSLFIKSVWALLSLTEQARVLVDRSWFQRFGFYLFFNEIVECVGFTFIYYDQGDSLLSKNVLCDADFNEYVGYIFNLIYYGQDLCCSAVLTSSKPLSWLGCCVKNLPE